MPQDTINLDSVLQNARRELLDLSTRNRLLSTSRGSSRSSRLEIVDERSDEVYRHLVAEGKAMSFLPAPSAENDTAEPPEGVLVQPEDQEPDEAGVSERHTDDKLQTSLTSEKLQQKLLKFSYDAKSYEEEQGVNILYLALGFLKWYEEENSDRERFAPLLLVPVSLSRSSATTRFRIRFTQEDVTTNLSLQARLKQDFGIELPDVPDAEELVPGSYFEQVASAVKDRRRWEVLPNDIVLWFFSFSKFLMYRDLDPASWPAERTLGQHPLIQAILQEGFGEEPPLCDERESIDPLIPPIDMVHVLDADSSQSVVIEEVKRGRNLVIQGPPGTGKSQTITNMIAAAVKAGKTVLFVAEKMAALEVVERRLANIGLGDMCLELHSHKANKRAVLDDLERALQLGRPKSDDAETAHHCEELKHNRDRLNRHLKTIHTPLSPCGFTPFQILGELVRLRAEGTRPADFQLADVLEWTRSEFETRLNLLKDLAERIREIGVPSAQAWRGVELEVILPTDIDRLMARLPQITARLEQLIAAGDELAKRLRISPPRTLGELQKSVRTARCLASAPLMDRKALASEVWVQRRSEIDRLIDSGRHYAARRTELADIVADVAWDTDVTAARRNLAAYGQSWFRWFHRPYREAMAALRGILKGQPSKKIEDRIALLDKLIEGQKTRTSLSEGSDFVLGREAFGTHWQGAESDWEALAAVCQWEASSAGKNVDKRFRTITADLDEVPDFGPNLNEIDPLAESVQADFDALATTLQLNLKEAFEAEEISSVPFEELLSRIADWRACPEALSLWVNYHIRRRRLESEGLAELVAQIHTGRTAAEEAVPRCEMACYEAWIRQLFQSEPELAVFSGSSHEQVLEKFRKLDQERIFLARQEVALAHYERLPFAGRAGVGEAGIVRHEIQKKRRHLPIRQLLARAGRAVQSIKPVFMMSPISVAQYLEPGLLDFDLLLIDEASQVQPVDALGAIARARQVVVVGDSKQLPPTTFFQRMLNEDGQDFEATGELAAGDLESILGLCCAQGMSQRMLSWHYRSRHHSLIAVSNREFYENRLYVVPSPGEASENQGLIFRHLPEGRFDRGGSATNPIEAKAVAQAVMQHARECPGKSLGVGTFSVSQRDAILDELEWLRRNDPSLEAFFANGSAEPFFVKNLENIQGDERDVIFISVGYGKDESGSMTMNFGPLSNAGGERRLNVLITRARECCRVFSSILAEDIDLTRAKARGAQALKTFLKYAETGLMDAGSERRGEPASEFERQVGEALASEGYETHPQVGVAGFFVDLAVVDPEQAGRYLLGIECDGANSHRARSARDRDRLRQAVLEDRGWVLHRIWSVDWFHRPEEERKKLLKAIEHAKIDRAGRGRSDENPSSPKPALPCEIDRHDDGGKPLTGNSPIASEPYLEARIDVPSDRAIPDLPADELARIISRVIEEEGPIHREEIGKRIIQLWGQQRTGSRIKEAIEEAMQVVSGDSHVACDGEFFFSKEKDMRLRDRSQVESSTLRKPEMLPPMEIRKALSEVAEVHLGVEAGDAVIETARLLGFKTTTPQLREVIEQELAKLVRTGRLENRHGKLYRAEPTGAAPGLSKQ